MGGGGASKSAYACFIPVCVQNDKKVVILREAKRSRRIHTAHPHPPPHGFRDFARNDGGYFY